MDYITTNIRLPEEDYNRLKYEAAKQRKSLAAIIREKLSNKNNDNNTLKSLVSETRKNAEANAQVIGNWDSLQALREIRSNS